MYPDTLLPETETLMTYVDDDTGANRVWAFAALGNVATEDPNVAASAIPRLIELVDAESPYQRANAGGLLAELADDYPTHLVETVPRLIALPGDDDKKVRYNATSMLAKLAATHPESVEPAIDPLLDALDAEVPYARSNACCALGRLEATVAEPTLRQLADDDPHEEGRHAATRALEQLQSGSRGRTRPQEDQLPWIVPVSPESTCPWDHGGTRAESAHAGGLVEGMTRSPHASRMPPLFTARSPRSVSACTSAPLRLPS